MSAVRRRVVVIDDHALFREGLISLLNEHDQIEIVGQGGTSAEAEELLRRCAPNALVLDVELDSTPASVLIRRLRRVCASTAIVVLTMHRDAVLRRELLQAGACAYLTKSSPSERVVAAICGANGPGDGGVSERPCALSLLTPRELGVLRLTSAGLTNEQIAHELGVAAGTVKRHLYNASHKLGASGRIDAVMKASRLSELR